MPIRTRTAKPRGRVITEEMVALFRRGLQLQKRGADDMGEYEPPHPRLRKEFIEIEQTLRRALGLFYDEMSVFDAEVADPNPPAFGWHRCIVQSWPKVRTLRVAL